MRAKSAWPPLPAWREVLLCKGDSVNGCVACNCCSRCALRCLVLTSALLCRCVATLRRHTLKDRNPASAGRRAFALHILRTKAPSSILTTARPIVCLLTRMTVMCCAASCKPSLLLQNPCTAAAATSLPLPAANSKPLTTHAADPVLLLRAGSRGCCCGAVLSLLDLLSAAGCGGNAAAGAGAGVAGCLLGAAGAGASCCSEAACCRSGAVCCSWLLLAS